MIIQQFILSTVGSEVVLDTNSLVFQISNERCVTVSVADNDTVTMGSHLYRLVSDPVPVLVYPYPHHSD